MVLPFVDADFAKEGVKSVVSKVVISDEEWDLVASLCDLFDDRPDH